MIHNHIKSLYLIMNVAQYLTLKQQKKSLSISNLLQFCSINTPLKFDMMRATRRKNNHKHLS